MAEYTIGFLVVENAEHTDHFECAAWHRTMQIKPGKYPLRIHDSYVVRNQRYFPKDVFCTLTGEITSNYLGAHHWNDEVGQDHQSTLTFYPYTIQHGIEWSLGKVELHSEFRDCKNFQDFLQTAQNFSESA